MAATELLRVAPGDPDGSHRESHASLIIRLARQNDVSPAKLLERKYQSERRSLTARAMGSSVANSLNGSSETTSALVRRTEELTKLSGVAAMTTLEFAKFSTINGTLRSTLAWSPGFLQEIKDSYYPLLWALEPVRVCPRARQPLATLCPRCRLPQRILTGGSHAGFCHRCESPLSIAQVHSGAPDPVAAPIRSIDYEFWIAEQLGEFIRWQGAHSLQDGFDFHQTLQSWMDVFDLKIDMASAARLGTSAASLSNWLRLGQVPRLRMTLNLCWVFGLSLLDFLHRRQPKSHPGTLQKSIDSGERYLAISRRQPIDRATLERRLTRIIRENLFPRLPFEEICRRKLGRLKRSPAVVRQYFPAEAKTIARRFQDNRQLEARIKQQQFCASIREVSRFLHERGITPNHKNLKPYLERPQRLRCAWAMTALNEVRCELGYADPAEQLLLPI